MSDRTIEFRVGPLRRGRIRKLLAEFKSEFDGIEWIEDAGYIWSTFYFRGPVDIIAAIRSELRKENM